MGAKGGRGWKRFDSQRGIAGIAMDRLNLTAQNKMMFQSDQRSITETNLVTYQRCIRRFNYIVDQPQALIKGDKGAFHAVNGQPLKFRPSVPKRLTQ